MNGLKGYYVKWNKSEKYKYSMISFVCEIWQKKKTQKNNKHDEERVSHVLLTVVVTSRDKGGGGIVSLRD